ncbi:MAG: PEF-CTERM sorting domain-containing protein [ANME-2 cluster archaeon]|nr:PEF-CTERM sorting domain-containing protein [ANME-2 cluster archaeon]
MRKLNRLILLLLVSLSTVAIVSADPLSVDVIPIDNQVLSGEMATYKVNLTNLGTTTETLTDLYASNGPGDFTYVFSDTSGAVLGGDTKQVDLSVTVPAGKPQGTYTFDVYADWQKPLGPFTISQTSNYLGVILDVEIPEFSTIALPIISVLGIMLLMSRRKERN